MRKTLLLVFVLSLSTSLFANGFVTLFMEQYAEENRPLSNVNIGKAMLGKMAENTADEELKQTFRELNSISIVSSDNKRDSRFYFKKANELVKEAFGDYDEVVSVNEKDSKISVLMKRVDEETSELILLSLDEESKLTIITVSGKIDFQSIAKLSGSLKEKPVTTELSDKEDPGASEESEED
ncbi:MAG: DUF4252 domain-containing protein [Proteiniphilum sp.]|nr:DUF4252 domain-containing protein [Proteiniphilum sp.]